MPKQSNTFVSSFKYCVRSRFRAQNFFQQMKIMSFTISCICAIFVLLLHVGKAYADSEADICQEDTCSEPLFDMTLDDFLWSAGKWASSMDLDPVHISTKMNMKGIKHYVEYLSLLEELHIYGNTTVRGWAHSVVKNISTPVQEAHPNFYHDDVSQTGSYKAPSHASKLPAKGWNSYHEKKFRQDSVSYLRACLRFERMGINTTYYRERIKQLLPKYGPHIRSRGLIQKLAFVLMFEQLDIPHPSLELPHRSYKDNMRHVFQRSTIAQRKDIDWLLEANDPPRL